MERLAATLRSLQGQSYPRLELVLVPVSRLPREAISYTGRLVEVGRQPDRTSALAAAVRDASGDFIGLLDAGDELAPNALAHAVRLFASEPPVDLIYADEDVLSEEGRSRPCLKPDWSPDTFLSLPYVGRPLWVRRALALEATAEPLTRGAEEYDFTLRVSEKARQVRHIPRILYHRWHTNKWGGHLRSLAEGRALQAALERRGIRGSVEPAPNCSVGWRVRYPIKDEAEVTVIIPSIRADLLEKCIRSVVEKTTYRHWRIMVVDNTGSGALQKVVAQFAHLAPVEYRRHDGSFSFSVICNAAVQQAATPYVCLLNDDTEVISSEWLEAMLEICQQPGIGAVGAKLLYQDRRIQHAGVAMGPLGVCGHIFRFWPGDSEGYFGSLSLIRNVAAVTGACMLVRRSVWLEVNGMEPALPVAYNDVDFCLRLLEKGYRIVITPYARLYHLESATKVTHAVAPEALRYIQERWSHYIQHDPYYHPAFTRESEDCSLAV